jgi:hypothetical protein
MSAARRPARSLTLTMQGFAAAWYHEQTAALAARPVSATATCAVCQTVYPAAGLSPFACDAAYAQAVQEVGAFDRLAPVCKFCKSDFAVSEDADADYADDLRSEARGIFY